MRSGPWEQRDARVAIPTNEPFHAANPRPRAADEYIADTRRPRVLATNWGAGLADLVAVTPR